MRIVLNDSKGNLLPRLVKIKVGLNVHLNLLNSIGKICLAVGDVRMFYLWSVLIMTFLKSRNAFVCDPI